MYLQVFKKNFAVRRSFWLDFLHCLMRPLLNDHRRKGPIYTLSEAWSGVNWADPMAAQGAFGTDFYDMSILRPKHRAYYRFGRPVIKIKKRRHGQPWDPPNSLRSKPRTETISEEKGQSISNGVFHWYELFLVRFSFKKWERKTVLLYKTVFKFAGEPITSRHHRGSFLKSMTRNHRSIDIDPGDIMVGFKQNLIL